MLLPSSSREGKRCRATEGVAVLVRHDMMAVIIMMSKSNSCLQNGRNAPDLSPVAASAPHSRAPGVACPQESRWGLGKPGPGSSYECAAYRIGRLRHLELQRCGDVLARSGQPANEAGDTGLTTQPSEKSKSSGKAVLTAAQPPRAATAQAAKSTCSTPQHTACHPTRRSLLSKAQ